MRSMRIALALSAVLVAVGLACGGGGASLSPVDSSPKTALTIADRLPLHNWRVRIDGCEGAMMIGAHWGSAWGCAALPTSTEPNPWPMLGGFATIAPDGQSVILTNDFANPAHSPYHAADGGYLPAGTMTGTFTDANHFSGTITGWGPPILITLELAE